MLSCASRETFWISWWGGEIHVGIGTEYNLTNTDHIMGGVKTKSFIPVALALEVTAGGVTVYFGVIESKWNLFTSLPGEHRTLNQCIIIT